MGSKLEAAGIKVEYVVGTPATHLAKIASTKGSPSIDVLEMGPAERIATKRDDLLADLSTSKILNIFKISLEVADKRSI